MTYETTSEGAVSEPGSGQAGDEHQQQPETVTHDGKLSGKLESVKIDETKS